MTTTSRMKSWNSTALPPRQRPPALARRHHRVLMGRNIPKENYSVKIKFLVYASAAICRAAASLALATPPWAADQATGFSKNTTKRNSPRFAAAHGLEQNARGPDLPAIPVCRMQVLRLRSETAIAVRSAVEGWQLTPVRAASRLGVAQPRLKTRCGGGPRLSPAGARPYPSPAILCPIRRWSWARVPGRTSSSFAPTRGRC